MLLNSRYNDISIDEPFELISVDNASLRKGDKIYVKSLGTYAIFSCLNKNKKEAEVYIGDIKTVVKTNDIFNKEEIKAPKQKININRTYSKDATIREINVIGKNSD
jgi:hypothetical protein